MVLHRGREREMERCWNKKRVAGGLADGSIICHRVIVHKAKACKTIDTRKTAHANDLWLLHGADDCPKIYQIKSDGINLME